VIRRRRGQRGQSLVLAALLITALMGFVGLVVDGGEAANEQQIVRSAADGAALAGAYSISKGSTIAAATTLAGQVLVAVPLPAGDLTMTYLDSGGVVTAVAASVAKVRAAVVDNHPTYFVKALGVPTVQLTATAEANVPVASGVAAACGLCGMGAAGTQTLTVGDTTSITITGGPVQVNSDTQFFDNNSTFTAPSIVFGGNNTNKGNNVSITPAPVIGAAIPDPLSAIPVPALAGATTAFTAPAGASTLPPGRYSTVTVPFGATLTLNPGTFVITTRLNITGGTVNGAGVTLFFGCASYPTACLVGQFGGHVTMSSGSLTLSPPASGTYFGLTVFADRNNVAANTFSSDTVIVTGTWYTLKQPLSDDTDGDSPDFGQLIVASFTTAKNQVIEIIRSASNSYGTGGGSGTIGLTL